MSHDFHDALPGYSPSQILHDGCAECQTRGKRGDHGIGSLDHHNFARAWKRAADWGAGGTPGVSEAEYQLLAVLWAVQLQLERRGIPIGEVPHG